MISFHKEYARMTESIPVPTLADTPAVIRDRVVSENHELRQRVAELEAALSELFELVEADAIFENRDCEPYKYEAIVDDVKRHAIDVLSKVRT